MLRWGGAGCGSGVGRSGRAYERNVPEGGDEISSPSFVTVSSPYNVKATSYMIYIPAGSSVVCSHKVCIVQGPIQTYTRNCLVSSLPHPIDGPKVWLEFKVCHVCLISKLHHRVCTEM